MKRLEPNDIAHYSKQRLISLAVDLSDTIDSAIQHNRLLDPQMKRLAEELGAQNQKVLFATEALGRLQSKVFGRSSEKSCSAKAMPQTMG